MSESDYSPEFVEALNAWEQGPPLGAEFVFDLPPTDKRKSDKVGVLMYQAVLMKQEHGDLDFSRIRAVTFTMDVHRTGEELENIAGHDLPQYRNAAARLDVFHINLGPGQILIITDELAVHSLSPQLATRLAAWELLRTELARSVAVARLADLPDPVRPPDSARWHSFARYVWTEYFCGLHAAVQAMSTPMARNRLREALEQDPVALAEAGRQFGRDGDLAEYATRAEGCAKGLCEAMAEVIGQLQGNQSTLDDTDPHLGTLIQSHGLQPLWEALRTSLVGLGVRPDAWTDTDSLALLAADARNYLSQQGLHYVDGAVTHAILPGPTH